MSTLQAPNDVTPLTVRTGYTAPSPFFTYFTGLMQVGLVVLFFTVATYDEDESSEFTQNLNQWLLYYIGIVIMMLIGFGYLMTFLMRGGLTAVGFTFIITMICVQVDIFSEAFWTGLHSGTWAKVDMSLNTLIQGNFAAAACLISFGALIGKANMGALAPLFLLETIAYSFNKVYIIGGLDVQDIGGTIQIHMFGAYFGLAASYVLGAPQCEEDKGINEAIAEKASRNSDIFSLIGTIFLWIFWPAFNGAGAPMGSMMQQRVLLNTIISLTTCCTWSFVMSRLYHNQKFGPVDIQNATLAGGVMVGVVANYKLYPAGAACIGIIAATVSVYGYNHIMEKYTSTFLHDTCGINNLHGMPSIVGATISVILSGVARSDDYKLGEYAVIFPNGSHQWTHQLGGFAATFVFAIATGALSMCICKHWLRQLGVNKFKDQEYWAIEYEDCDIPTSPMNPNNDYNSTSVNLNIRPQHRSV